MSSAFPLLILPNCPKHAGMPLNQVCTNPSCIHQSLCCSKCRAQVHDFHIDYVQDIDEFLTQTLKKLSINSKQNNLQFLYQLMKSKEDLESRVLAIEKQFVIYIKKIKQAIKNQFTTIIQSFEPRTYDKNLCEIMGKGLSSRIITDCCYKLYIVQKNQFDMSIDKLRQINWQYNFCIDELNRKLNESLSEFNKLEFVTHLRSQNQIFQSRSLKKANPEVQRSHIDLTQEDRWGSEERSQVIFERSREKLHKQKEADMPRKENKQSSRRVRQQHSPIKEKPSSSTRKPEMEANIQASPKREKKTIEQVLMRKNVKPAPIMHKQQTPASNRSPQTQQHNKFENGKSFGNREYLPSAPKQATQANTQSKKQNNSGQVNHNQDPRLALRAQRQKKANSSGKMQSQTPPLPSNNQHHEKSEQPQEAQSNQPKFQPEETIKQSQDPIASASSSPCLSLDTSSQAQPQYRIINGIKRPPVKPTSISDQEVITWFKQTYKDNFPTSIILTNKANSEQYLLYSDQNFQWCSAYYLLTYMDEKTNLQDYKDSLKHY